MVMKPLQDMRSNNPEDTSQESVIFDIDREGFILGNEVRDQHSSRLQLACHDLDGSLGIGEVPDGF